MLKNYVVAKHSEGQNNDRIYRDKTDQG